MQWESAFSDIGVTTHSSQMTLGRTYYYYEDRTQSTQTDRKTDTQTESE